MKEVRSIVLSGYGTNCEMETAHACRIGGSDIVDIVHITQLIKGEKRLDDYHFLALPGGFLDGDDLGAAKAGANRIQYATVTGTDEKLYDQIVRFIRDGKLILGICNGFQLMAKLGLIPSLRPDSGIQDVTLTFNDSGRFEDRWVYLKVNQESPSVFTKGVKGVYLPVRHGEGKFIPRDEGVRAQLLKMGLIVLSYSDSDYSAPTAEYPLNPNGSMDAVAAVSDPTGRLLGMMPHPEAYLHRTNHPRWTREELPEEGMGVAFFKNAVQYIRSHLL